MTKAEALAGSIKKWENIVNGTGIDQGPTNCPLCLLFWAKDCIGCPVSEKSGESFCYGTPYEEWEKHTNGCLSEVIEHCPECRRLAQAELDFLRSLKA